MNEDIKYTIQKIFGSYSINVADDYVSKTYYDVQDDIIRIIKQLEKQNTELKDNWNKLKEWLEEEITTIKNNFSQVNGNYFMMNDRIEVLEDTLDKMQEIEGGMNV